MMLFSEGTTRSAPDWGFLHINRGAPGGPWSVRNKVEQIEHLLCLQQGWLFSEKFTFLDKWTHFCRSKLPVHANKTIGVEIDEVAYVSRNVFGTFETLMHPPFLFSARTWGYSYKTNKLLNKFLRSRKGACCSFEGVFKAERLARSSKWVTHSDAKLLCEMAVDWSGDGDHNRTYAVLGKREDRSEKPT